MAVFLRRAMLQKELPRTGWIGGDLSGRKTLSTSDLKVLKGPEGHRSTGEIEVGKLKTQPFRMVRSKIEIC